MLWSKDGYQSFPQGFFKLSSSKILFIDTDIFTNNDFLKNFMEKAIVKRGKNCENECYEFLFW